MEHHITETHPNQATRPQEQEKDFFTWRTDAKLRTRELAATVAAAVAARVPAGLSPEESAIVGRTPSYFRGLSSCGSYLEIEHYADDDPRLVRADFCGCRLCPTCANRRAARLFRRVEQVMDALPARVPGVRFLLLTLTQKNVSLENLSSELSRLSHAWSLFRRADFFTRVALGFIRTVECTRNDADGSYHPHQHIILAVPAEYFDRKKSLYMSHDDLLDAWASALGLPPDAPRPGADIRVADRGKGGTSAAAYVLKAAAYATKTSDLALTLSGDELLHFGAALSGKRFFSSGGLFREIRAELDAAELDRQEVIVMSSGDAIPADVWERWKKVVSVSLWRWSGTAYDLSETVDDPYPELREWTPAVRVRRREWDAMTPAAALREQTKSGRWGPHLDAVLTALRSRDASTASDMIEEAETKKLARVKEEYDLYEIPDELPFDERRMSDERLERLVRCDVAAPPATILRRYHRGLHWSEFFDKYLETVASDEAADAMWREIEEWRKDQ